MLRRLLLEERYMAPIVESAANTVSQNERLVNIPVGGFQILGYEIRPWVEGTEEGSRMALPLTEWQPIRVPMGVHFHIPDKMPVAHINFGLTGGIEWDTLSAMIRSAQRMDISDTTVIEIDKSADPMQVRVGDMPSLILLQSFYHGHGDAMLVRQESGESVSVIHTPIPGHTSPVQTVIGYEAIPAGAVFSLLEIPVASPSGIDE